MVNDRNDISDLRKIIYYLQQILIGDAASILGQLRPGQDNYECAWKWVNETHENKRRVN